jgi:metal-sulfur cluster biosynthetic enzyme
MSAAVMSTATRVLEELDRVHDPEVDQPVTSMGFIRSVVVSGRDVVVRMQLPTYFCAPNFTWLMVEDVRIAAERVVGPGHATVELDGHFESERISNGVGSGAGFAKTFAGQAVEDLDGIRDRFRRKTFLIRQEKVCRAAEDAGVDPDELCDLDLVDIACLDLPEFGKYLTTREELGISCRHSAPFLVAADGRPVGPENVRAHRRSASVMAVSFEGNGHMCRTLIEQRYPTSQTQQGEVA